MSPISRLLVLATLACAATSLSSSEALAHGAVLSPATGGSPSVLDVTIAVASTPYGSTRWSRITFGGGSRRVLWLVPARPGAAVDWARDGWLDALDDASAPRIAPPTNRCDAADRAERPPTLSQSGVQATTTNVTIHTTAADARDYAQSEGFEVSPVMENQIAAVIDSGLALVSVEVDAPLGASASTSPTLRVSDNAPAAIPLALTGSTSTRVRVTAFAISDGPRTISGAPDVSVNPISWANGTSDYVRRRDDMLDAYRGWLRESSSHSALFDRVGVFAGTPIAPVSESYFRGAIGQPQPACAGAAKDASNLTGTLGRVCAEGALGRVPGGSPCTPTNGSVPTDAFTCGGAVDDLALALSGIAPSSAVVSRFAGIVPYTEALGSDVSFSPTAYQNGPVYNAKLGESCGGGGGGSSPPGGGGGSSGAYPSDECADGNCETYTTTSGGCGGSTTVVETVDSDGEPTESSSSSEGCGSSSTASDSSGWDDNDDDSCSKSSTSSSSSSSGDSGWDSSDDDSKGCSCDHSDSGGESAAPKASLAPRRHTKKSSPLSRLVILAVALVLPLRRRARLR